METNAHDTLRKHVETLLDNFPDGEVEEVINYNRVLRLGRPGEFLAGGGVADAEIIMEFDMFVRKSGDNYKNDHPFTKDDIKDMPRAINTPIAVFESAHDGDKVILTELKKYGLNFIVAIRAIRLNRKGGIVLQLNNIETLYPKKEKGIIDWILKGSLANVDKEKALSWLSALQTHPETEQAKKELDNAANVVKDFKGPKYSVEKNSNGERKYSLSARSEHMGAANDMQKLPGEGSRLDAKSFYNTKKSISQRVNELKNSPHTQRPRRLEYPLLLEQRYHNYLKWQNFLSKKVVVSGSR